MKTKEVSQNEWPNFFDRFSSQHKGKLVSLEILGADIGAQVEERNLALEGIAAEWHQEKGNQISIMIGARPDDHITHSIASPIQVSLEQTDQGADSVLAIKSADGSMALLKLSSPMVV